MNPLPLSRGISRHPVGSRFGAYEFKAVQRENVFPWFNVSGCDLQGTWFKSEKISSLPCLRTLQVQGCHTYLLVISVDQTWVLTTHWLPLLVASWILHSWNLPACSPSHPGTWESFQIPPHKTSVHLPLHPKAAAWLSSVFITWDAFLWGLLHKNALITSICTFPAGWTFQSRIPGGGPLSLTAGSRV